jgi:hypothetical protein
MWWSMAMEKKEWTVGEARERESETKMMMLMA